jgi:hypothetical protein
MFLGITVMTQIQQNLTKPYCSQFGFGYQQIVFAEVGKFLTTHKIQKPWLQP